MEFMVKEMLLAVLLGTTHYVDTGKPQPAIIYYEDAKVAHMRLPNGNALKGAWRMTDAGYAVAWGDGTESEWRIAREPERLYYVDAAGADRGHITKIVPGDAADLGE